KTRSQLSSPIKSNNLTQFPSPVYTTQAHNSGVMRNFLQPNPPQKSPTDAKLNANRQNAQRSTGPRTPEGKKRSSLNATRHGLTGQVHVTTESDRKVYDSHCGEFFQDWQPQGATEKHLVQTVAEKQWQSHRADAELRSVHAIAYAEFADKIDTEHPEVHMALTTGLVALE